MDCTETTATLTRAELRALLAHASKDVTRPHLCGVVFDAIGGRLWATDGHRAAIAKPAASSGRPGDTVAIVPRAPLEEASRLAAGSRLVAIRLWSAGTSADGARALSSGAGRCTVEVLEDTGANVATLHAQLVDATPPPIDQVIPSADAWASRSAWSAIDPRYLGALAAVASAADASGVRIWAAAVGEGDVPSPVLVECHGPRAHWTLAIMPMQEQGNRAPALVPASAVAGAEPAAPPAAALPAVEPTPGARRRAPRRAA